MRKNSGQSLIPFARETDFIELSVDTLRFRDSSISPRRKQEGSINRKLYQD